MWECVGARSSWPLANRTSKPPRYSNVKHNTVTSVSGKCTCKDNMNMDHVLTCSHGGAVIMKHDMVVDALHKELVRYRCVVRKEVVVTANAKDRMDLIVHHNGTEIWADVTVGHPMCKTYIQAGSFRHEGKTVMMRETWDMIRDDEKMITTLTQPVCVF